MPSRFRKLSADRMPTTPNEVRARLRDWQGHERWGRLVMSCTATRFLHEYHAAVDVLHQDPVTAYATAWRAIYGPTTPNEETTDAHP